MRRTLLLIPHELASIPIFGFGWVLGIMVACGIAISLYVKSSGRGVAAYWQSNAMLWGFGAIVVTTVLPRIELLNVSGDPIGMAVRGYGVMLLLGVVASVWLAVVRGDRYGISADAMLGLAPWLLIGGILGARAFYVIEYRDQFFSRDIGATIRNLLNFTEGGLVVYGGFIAGFFASAFYIVKHHLPLLKMGDAIVPCMFIGLSLGRIGCLMNGCCYGNACEPSWSALRFPNSSPVYQDQLASGELVGIKLNVSGTQIESVRPESPAARSGVSVGADVSQFGTVRSAEEMSDRAPLEDAPLGLIAMIDGKEYYWPASKLPTAANPVAPSQIISSAGAFFLCVILCVYSRFATRDGMVMLVGFASYAVLRFIMEMLRNDEPGQFGTELTIAQWVSIVVFSSASVAMVWLNLMARFPIKTPSEQTGTAGG